MNNKIRTLQLELLEMMKFFDGFCRSNNIKYSLGYGSLLGAVRHKGFIPWDDDLDIIVDRDNHNKIIEAVNRDGLGKYQLIRDLWIPRVAKQFSLDGKNGLLCIDILVFDNKPDTRIKSSLKLFSVLVLQGMLKKGINKKRSLLSRLLSIITLAIGKLFPVSVKQSWYEIVSQWGNGKRTKMLKPYHGEFMDLMNEEHRSDFLEHYVDLDFEGCRFMCVKEWDLVLRETFGDYMELPPIEERVPKHIGSALLFLK